MMQFSFLIILIVVAIAGVKGSIRQYVTFYTEPDCKGEEQATIYTRYDASDSDPESTSGSIIPNARSARVFGLWWFIVKDARTDFGVFGWMYNGGASDKRTINVDLDVPCNTGSIYELMQLHRPSPAPGSEGHDAAPAVPFTSLQYIMLYQLGPSEVDRARAITFYSETNFRGISTQIMFDIDVAGQTLDEPTFVMSLVFVLGSKEGEQEDRSLGLMGNDGWTLYSEPNFVGIAYHVIIDPILGDGDVDGVATLATDAKKLLYFISSINEESETGIQVGSVRPGLHFYNESGGVIEFRTIIVGNGDNETINPVKTALVGWLAMQQMEQDGHSKLLFQDQLLVFIAVGLLTFFLACGTIFLILTYFKCFGRRSQKLTNDQRNDSWKQLLISE